MYSASSSEHRAAYTSYRTVLREYQDGFCKETSPNAQTSWMLFSFPKYFRWCMHCMTDCHLTRPAKLKDFIQCCPKSSHRLSATSRSWEAGTNFFIANAPTLARITSPHQCFFLTVSPSISAISTFASGTVPLRSCDRQVSAPPRFQPLRDGGAMAPSKGQVVALLFAISLVNYIGTSQLPAHCSMH